MADVLNVAQYVLKKLDYVSTMKLQKIVFYSQAYHLVKHGIPLFDNRIEAWINGPVVPDLFDCHKGQFIIPSDFLDKYGLAEISMLEKQSVDHVFDRIGDRSGADLSKLTHKEDPWLRAREGYKNNERCAKEITLESIKQYYSSSCCTNPVFA